MSYSARVLREAAHDFAVALRVEIGRLLDVLPRKDAPEELHFSGQL